MDTVRFQSPDLAHARPIARLVRNSDRLDDNSTYAYALWCTHFAAQSAVAIRDDEVIAFVTGFRSPQAPQTYFLWQTAARPRHGVPNLGVDLIMFAVAREIDRGARYIEASVDRDNRPIRLLMTTLNRRIGGAMSEHLLYDGSILSDGPSAHHDEMLLRITVPDARTTVSETVPDASASPEPENAKAG